MSGFVPTLLLRQYIAEAGHVKSAQNRLACIRSRIVELARAGLRAERGSLDFRFVQYETRPLTQNSIVDALGIDAFEQLRAAVRPVIRERLTVFEVACGRGVDNRSGSNQVGT
jgi:hypothetical protein